MSRSSPQPLTCDYLHRGGHRDVAVVADRLSHRPAAVEELPEPGLVALRPSKQRTQPQRHDVEHNVIGTGAEGHKVANRMLGLACCGITASAEKRLHENAHGQSVDGDLVLVRACVGPRELDRLVQISRHRFGPCEFDGDKGQYGTAEALTKRLFPDLCE